MKFYQRLLLLSLVWASCWTISIKLANASNESIESRIFKKVIYANEQGKLLEAKKDIQRVLKLNPHHKGATFFAGLYSFKKGNTKTAKKFFSRLTNHPKYGAKARSYLAEIRLDSYKNQFHKTLNTKLKGESYLEALKLCAEALAEMPNNTEILLKATYASTMLGHKQQAYSYLTLYTKKSGNRISSAELQAFVDAWFKAGYEPELSLEKLLQLTDKRLITPPVKNRMKELIKSLKLVDKFESFIINEKSLPGANINQLDRELISFYISQNQFEKAEKLLNTRPIDSLEDNLLFIQLYIKQQKEKKAMLMARHLIGTTSQDLRIYKVWTEAYLTYYERTSTMPEGSDDSGKEYSEMTEDVLDHVKFDKILTSQPELALDLIRLAAVTSNSKKVKILSTSATRLAFTNNLVPLLMKTCDLLIATNNNLFAATILESAQNQLSENSEIQIKLAEIYFMNDSTQKALQILEELLDKRPQLIKAFMLWVDCKTELAQFNEAENAILERLEDPEIIDLIEQQLSAKLEVVRMKMQQELGSQDSETSESFK